MGYREGNSFKRIYVSSWLCEYKGVVNRCRGTGIEHNLFAVGIDKAIARSLIKIDEIGNDRPTHAVFCYCIFPRNPNKAHLLFSAFLYLTTKIDSPGWQDWATFKIVEQLAIALSSLKDFHFLVPCDPKKPAYEWCASDEEMQEFWAIEVDRWRRT